MIFFFKPECCFQLFSIRDHVYIPMQIIPHSAFTNFMFIINSFMSFSPSCLVLSIVLG